MIDRVKINLGCGKNKQDGYVNIDIQERVKPDVVCDVLKGLPYEDSSVDEVRAFDFLEHIETIKNISVIEEIWRVLRPGGKFESFTPDAECGQGAFQDPTHVSFWTEGVGFIFRILRTVIYMGLKQTLEYKCSGSIPTQLIGYSIYTLLLLQ